MPDKKTLDDFIATVVRGEHDIAVEQFYAEDAALQENLGEIRRGREAHAARERRFLTQFKEIRTTCVAPVFVNGDHVVIHWIFEFVRKDGAVMRMEELAHQRWEGNKMAEERFYYDPAQRVFQNP
jgi:ketosteroid isomerase-like protein